MAILAVSDFTDNQFGIAIDKNSTLTEFITDENLKQYLYPLLGEALADEYIADPTAEKFDEINTSGYYQKQFYAPLKYVLKCFVYSDYTSYQANKNLSVGNSTIDAEGSKKATLKGQAMYNEGVKNANIIQKYCRANFTNFDGVIILYASI